MSSAICFNLDKSEILFSGNGLIEPAFENEHKIFLEKEKMLVNCIFSFSHMIS